MGLNYRTWANVRKKLTHLQERQPARRAPGDSSGVRGPLSGRDSYLVTTGAHPLANRPCPPNFAPPTPFEPANRPPHNLAADVLRGQHLVSSSANGSTKGKVAPFEQLVSRVFDVVPRTPSVSMEIRDVDRLLTMELSGIQMEAFLRGLCEPALPHLPSDTLVSHYAVDVYIPDDVQEYLFAGLLDKGYENALRYMVIRTKAEQVTREAMFSAIHRRHAKPVMVEAPAHTEQAWSPLFLARIEPDQQAFEQAQAEFIYIEYLMPTDLDGPVENARIYKGPLQAMVELEQTQPVKTTSASSIYYLDTLAGQLIIDTASVKDWGVRPSGAPITHAVMQQYSLSDLAPDVCARRDLIFGGDLGPLSGLYSDYWYEPIDPGHLNRMRDRHGYKASLTLFDARHYSQEINAYIDRTPFDPWA
jgi:hypothetical protein